MANQPAPALVFPIRQFLSGPARTNKGLNELVKAANQHEEDIKKLKQKGNIIVTISMIDGFAMYTEEYANVKGPVPVDA